MKKESINKIWIISVYAVAMAFLETAVVIYIRELYYKGGFDFPLRMSINPIIMNTEWIREFATIVMLAAIGFLASKKTYERFAYFIYAFAIWDIFYYVFLKLAIDWPSSFLTWDLLFLIPWSWLGPVITPVICSLLFIALALLIIQFSDSGKAVKFSPLEWALFVLAGISVLYTWLYDYGKIIFSNGLQKDFLTLSTNPKFISIVSEYVPSFYNWILFGVAVAMVLAGIASFYRRYSKKN